MRDLKLKAMLRNNTMVLTQAMSTFIYDETFWYN
jgi:hypothetical protein